MRIIPVVVAVAIAAFASRAEADVSKAWAAAKDNLPAGTRLVVVIDATPVLKSAAFAKLLAAARVAERDIEEGYSLIKNSCKVDPVSLFEGAVIAADPEKEEGAVYLQVTVDRAKASACLQSMFKAAGKTSVTVKQDGIYTVLSKGSDTIKFAWVAPNVVVSSIDPEKTAMLDAWIGKKGFAKSTVAEQFAKTDGKAIAAGAFSLSKPIDRDLPVTQGHGHLMFDKGKLTGILLGRATDAAAATKLATALQAELVKDMNRKRTPEAVRKIMAAIAIAAVGADISIKGSVSDGDLVDAFIAAMSPKKRIDATEPAKPQP